MTGAALLALAAAAAGWPLASSGDIPFVVDGAAFSSGNGQTWQELYWSCPANAFAPVETSAQRLSRFRTTITLADSAGGSVLNESWSTTAPLPTDAELKRKSIVRLDQIGCRGLRPGPYRLTFSITDLANGRSGLVDQVIAVPAIPGDRPALSQIQLASEIAPDSTGQRFRKGGLRVTPNPDRAYSPGGALYYYFELYGLAQAAGQQLTITYNSDNDSVTGTVHNETLDGIGRQAVRTGGFRIDEMPAGAYQLWAQLKDAAGRRLAVASAGFSVRHDPLAATPQAGLMRDEQEALQRQGGRFYGRIEYLANGKMLDTYRSLDSAGQREFLRQFWKARDPDPKTPENEALREHVRRCEFANETFGEQIRKGLEGSQTDRGRIYVKFGEPEEIVSKPIQPRDKPLIIWRYPGSKKFIFVDISGFGRYELIYTNFPATSGERSDPSYDRILSDELMESEDIRVRGENVKSLYDNW
jgi:GWxTD domain-containing protein